jgi:mono/diheme cytochrome c family protein
MRRKPLALALLLVGVAGCDRYYNDVPGPDDLMHIIPWFDAMIKQRSVRPYERADVPRYAVAGTVPVSGGEGDWSMGDPMNLSYAFDPAVADKVANPLAGQPATATGDTLYHTFCSVCHGQTGAGNGLVGVKLGALSLLTDKARGYTDGYLYSMIRYGRGVMPLYGDKIRGTDRWQVVNYVRQLQGAVTAGGGGN